MRDYDEPTGPDEEMVLELAKTQLLVYDDELQRLNSQGGVVLRLPLSAIEEVEFRTSFDPFCLVFAAMGIGLALLGYFVSESNVLSTLLYVAAVLLVGGAFFGMKCPWILVKSDGGTTHIQCRDLTDECQGFVRSLQQILKAGRWGRGGRRR